MVLQTTVSQAPCCHKVSPQTVASWFENGIYLQCIYYIQHIQQFQKIFKTQFRTETSNIFKLLVHRNPVIAHQFSELYLLSIIVATHTV